jgi:hypothetical protein
MLSINDIFQTVRFHFHSFKFILKKLKHIYSIIHLLLLLLLLL